MPRIRATIVMVTTTACLLLTGTPASAAVVTASVVPPSSGGGSGNITFHPTGTGFVVPLEGTCISEGFGNTFTLDVTATTLNILDVDLGEEVVMGTTRYIMRVDRTASTAGSISGGSAIANARATLDIDFYIATDPTSCALGAKVCDLAVGVTFSGTYTGTPATPTSGDLVNLSGSNHTPVVVNPTCTAAFAGFVGKPVTLDVTLIVL